MRRVACVYFPDWSVQNRLLSRQPDDRRPLVVASTAGGRGERVVACCTTAAAAGVRPGLPVAEARSMLLEPVRDSNVGLEVVAADEERDLRLLTDEARRAWRFTPLVALPRVGRDGRSRGHDARSRVESLLANITGCGHLFGDEEGLALAMQEDWSRRGLRVRVSVAGSPGTAWAIAHAAHWTSQPWVPLVVSPERDELWMRRLPIEALALEPGVLQALGELDVMKVGRLLELPTGEIKRRFGDETLQRISRALGWCEEPLEFLPMPDPVVACRVFEHPVSRWDWLEEALEKLVMEVATDLEWRGQVSWRLVCRVRSEGESERVEWVTGLVEPSRDAGHLWELVKLAAERRRWPSQVIELEVSAEGLAVPERLQQTLFEAEIDGREARARFQRGMARLVERLSSRLGDEAVARPVMCDAVVPELAVMLEPMGRERDIESGSNSGGRGGPVGRPMRLMARPRPIEVMAVVPEGPPVRFSWEDQDRRVVRCWGPERIETGWWTDCEVARDYYRVETGTGEWYWLFRRRGDDEWFVHGIFE